MYVDEVDGWSFIYYTYWGYCIEEELFYVEVPANNRECHVQKLRTKEVESVKFIWSNQLVEEDINKGIGKHSLN